MAIKKGDIVILTKNQDDVNIDLVGKYGVVISDQQYNRFGVDFFLFNGTTDGHDCDGLIDRETGWWIDSDNLRKISEE